jgi:hypothetical protein
LNVYDSTILGYNLRTDGGTVSVRLQNATVIGTSLISRSTSFIDYYVVNSSFVADASITNHIVASSGSVYMVWEQGRPLLGNLTINNIYSEHGSFTFRLNRWDNQTRVRLTLPPGVPLSDSDSRYFQTSQSVAWSHNFDEAELPLIDILVQVPTTTSIFTDLSGSEY